jgi:rare lipoprotein A
LRPFLRAVCLALLALGVLTLAGCGSTPKRGGGFYQDDGPPRDAPRDLERTPDAVPRVEPFHPFANRPYTALGRSYTPITDDRPFRQRGFASWYGRQFHGNKTASGERYDMLAMTAAHPTLPLPSYVRVTNLKSGASVIVRVNDRGPFKADRIIDLSYAAATRLGIAGTGTGEVEVLRLTHADIRAGRYGSGSSGSSSVASDEAPRLAVSARAPLPPSSAPGSSMPAPPSVLPATSGALPAVAAAPATVLSPMTAVVPSMGASAPSVAAPMPTGSWAVQLGAFEQAANADALRDRLALLLGSGDGFSAEERAPRVQRDGSVHRVLIGQFGRREEAQALAARLERALHRDTSLYLAR